MTPKIREARGDDAEAIARLSVQLGYPATAGDMLLRIQRLGELEEHGLFIAEHALGVVAWVHVSRRKFLEVPDYAEINGLVVDEQVRGKGIGSALVERAERWALERGLNKLRVRSNILRERTHAFYGNLGFKKTKAQTVFDKTIV